MSDSKNNNNNIAMAVIRDKFHSSAKELIKNLEDAVNGRKRVTDSNSNSSGGGANSFENAFRVMFSSCTLGAEGATTTDQPGKEFQYNNNNNNNSDMHYSPSLSPSQSHSPRSAGAAIKTVSGTQGFLHNRDLGEHIYAQLFYDDQQRAEQAVHALRDQPKFTEPTVPALAATALTATTTAPRSSTLPKPFPVSTPHMPSPPPLGSPLQAEELNIPNTLTFDDGISAISAHTLEAMAQCLPVKTRSELSRESSLFPSSPEASTDERDAAVATTPATLGASKSPFGTTTVYPPPPPTTSHHRSSSFPRIRSHNTSLGSITGGGGGGSSNSCCRSKASPGRMSLKSKNSYSTQTTESSSFEHWHRQEMKYWEDVAQRQADDDDEFYQDDLFDDDPHHDYHHQNSPDRSKRSSSASERRRMRATKVRDLVSKSQQQQHHHPLHDNYTSTTTTTMMTASTSWTANFDRHPHETFPFDAVAAANNSDCNEDGLMYSSQSEKVGPPNNNNNPFRRHHLNADRHRIESVLLLPGTTEMGEI